MQLQLGIVEKINQQLGLLDTYALLLSELEFLETLPLAKKEITADDIIDYCRKIIIIRLQKEPDLSWNKTLWDLQYAEEKDELKDLKNKTGFIIGL